MMPALSRLYQAAGTQRQIGFHSPLTAFSRAFEPGHFPMALLVLVGGVTVYYIQDTDRVSLPADSVVSTNFFVHPLTQLPH
jgi:hypothetical protein